jgi:2-polyprenyl-6-methoxyphenol hydroxylase-like FAD-dependent oxidoreductase
MADTKADVVIVGAGPTGLALAAELQRLGTPALLVDKHSSGENTSRATVVHARTLEVLEPLGVTQQLIDRGLILHTARMHEGDTVRAHISFDGLDTAYSYILVCTQDQTEEVLTKRLRELGGGEIRAVEVTEVHPDDDGVTATYVAGGVLIQDVRAKWLVACDGMHSMVRQSAGIGFEGGNYEENFVLADVEMETPLGRKTMDLFFSPEGLLLIVPLPHDRYRVIATMLEAPSAPSLDDVQKILDTRGPQQQKCRATGLVWSSRFRIQHRVATQLRKGRVLICGDAAHVHSPAGGQGMNTGIQDAVSLAQVLHTAVTTGDESGFAEWEKKRLAIARSVVKTTDVMTRVAASDSSISHLVRNLVMGAVEHSSTLQRVLAERLSEIDNK